MSLHVIILAAGRGTRMKSSLPKVMHCLAGRPLLAHVLDTARQIKPSGIRVVYGYGGDVVQAGVGADDIRWIHQRRRLGTGHAVRLALQDIADTDRVCILYGDVPLLTANTLISFLDAVDQLGILTAVVDRPAGYGRIIRGTSGTPDAIVEDRDADGAQKQIREINTGIMAGNAGLMKRLLMQVDDNNERSEIYLTDVIALAVGAGIAIDDYTTDNETEITGVNDKLQLAAMERNMQQQIARDLMRSGVTLYDPARFDVRGELNCGKDVKIDVNCVIEGRVELHDSVSIGPNVYLKNCTIGADTIIKPNCVIEGCVTGRRVIIGPFARIRPGTELKDAVCIGNFVETKNSVIDEVSKVSHLTYIGDSQIGKRVNVGAGTVTCNYDGADKHKTIIEDDAFIGSGTELVAPIKIGKGATVGAGSTLSAAVADDVLVVERSHPRTIEHWRRPGKK